MVSWNSETFWGRCIEGKHVRVTSSPGVRSTSFYRQIVSNLLVERMTAPNRNIEFERISLPAILMFTRGTRCWHTAISLSIIFERLIPGLSVPNVEILSGKVIKISQISTFLSHFWTKAQQQMLVTERAPKGLEPITKITLKLNHVKTC